MNEFKIMIPSDVKLIEPVINALNTIAEELLLDEENKWALEISLREALANAIVHGNREDNNKYVKIKLEWDNKKFTIIVEDEGEGFVPSVSDNTPSLKTSGRGILILENKMDSVKYENSSTGFRLILTKNIS